MLQLTFASLRTQARRLIAPGLAIILGVAFVAATLTLGSSLTDTLRQQVAGQYAPFATVVRPSLGDHLPATSLAAARGTTGVDQVEATRAGTAMIATRRGEEFATLTTAPILGAASTAAEGRLPAATDEIAIPTTWATANRIRLGTDLPVTAYGSDGQTNSASLRVVGLIDTSDDSRYAGSATLFATPSAVTKLTDLTGWTQLAITATPGSDAETVTAAVRTALSDTLPKGATVRTGTAQADAEIDDLARGTSALTGVLSGFAAIALFVAAIVIANTFSILLARRTRETALLRAVGATKSQVTRSALLEALLTGAVFTALGTLAGVGLGWVLTRVSSGFLGSAIGEMVFSVTPRDILIPLVVGIVVVILAALRPVRRASAVAPLAALRPAPGRDSRTAGRMKLLAGAALIAIGGGALVLGMQGSGLVIGMAGGLLSFLGVMLIGTILVPAVARVVGIVPARLFGTPGRLALGNAVANPRRAAATASALLVGITLVTMTAVAARSAQSSVDAALDQHLSIDASIASTAGPLSERTVQQLRDVDGVGVLAPIPGAEVKVDGEGGQVVVGIGADARSALRNPALVSSLRDGVALVSSEAAAEAGVTNGDTLALQGPTGARTVKVSISDALGYPLSVTESDLRAMTPQPDTRGVIIRLADGADGQAVLDRISTATADVPSITIGGSASERAQLTEALDIVLYVVLGLLGISVLIALVGIANTLSLSVIERTQESALLRALGTTRGQLRGMLAIEAAVLAAVGVVVGSALGVAYGWAGTRSALGSALDTQLTIPWTIIGGVALVAITAAVLASVLPARRATRVAPAQALAAD
ncbi:ABC transporter permease [Janibacter sp. GXQ6167]|uniref:ABC transporter permease n=1 Tax=Janibacter sp. GXQ6167 TaxID=3240791 RepID=UPI0035256D3C